MNIARRIQARTAALAATVLVAGLSSATAVLAWPASAGSASAATPTSAPRSTSTGPGTYVAVLPARILDTRAGIGAKTAQVAGHGSLSFAVAGVAGVPSAAGVSAVVFNLTVTRTTAAGYISAYAAGTAVPATSSTNFAAGETRAHSVVVAPGADGKVTLRNGSVGALDLIADIAGYYTAGAPTAGGEFASLAPARVLDTRTGLGAPGGPVKHGVAFSVPLAGRGGIPSTGVSAVVLNATVTQASRSGFLSVTSFINGSTANVNFVGGQTVSNLVVVPLADDGTVRLEAFMDGDFSATAQVVADVSGYFRTGPPSVAGRFGGLSPTNLVQPGDRDSVVATHGTLTLAVAGQEGIPQSGVIAAVLNVTVVEPYRSGYVTAYPSGTRPATSTVNFAHHTMSNLVVAAVGSDGNIRIYNGSPDSITLQVAVTGFVGPIPGPLTWSARTAFPPGTSIDALSCASASFCAAADRAGSVLFFDGTTWSPPQTDSFGPLDSISCPEPGFCMALSTTTAGVLAYSGGTWTHTAPGPPFISAISCLSESFCIGAQDEAHAWIYDGTSWTSTDTGLPLGDDGDGGHNGLVVGCASTTLCLGLGTDGGTAVFDGTAWTVSTTFSSAPTAVSCPSPTQCVAVGESSIVAFDATGWGTPIPAASMREVSCWALTNCVGTDQNGNVRFHTGTTWTTPVTLDVDGVKDVSCPAADFCVAVDESGAFLGT